MRNPERLGSPIEEEVSSDSAEPKGSIEIQKGSAELPREPEHVESTKEKKGFLEQLRTYPAIRPIVIGLALEIGALAWHVKQKFQEKGEIEQLATSVKTELSNIEYLKERGERLRELFGNNLPFSLDVAGQLEALQGGEEQVRTLEKSFSWFKEKRPILAEPSELLEPPPSSEEREQAGVKVNDFVLHPEYYEVGKVEQRIDSATVDRILAETYPKGWIRGEVASVEQLPDTQLMGDRYGLGKDAESVATHYKGGEGGKSKIVFHGISKQGYSANEIFGILAHELGHANDWSGDNEMNREEKMDLLLHVGDRLDDEDRYYSSYVEAIQNDDEQRERYLKASEYWAEICEAYFSDPGNMNYTDYALVEEHLKKQDPNFNRDRAMKLRFELLQSSLSNP